MMAGLRRVAAAVLLSVLAVAGGVLGWRWWAARAAVQATDNAYVRGEITALSPRVAGYAVEVLADVNQPVEAKQVLVRIDPRDYRAALDRAEAARAQAEAALEQAQARLDLQRSLIEVAEAGLRAAEAQAQNAGRALRRAQELRGTGAGTQARLDDAVAADVAAQAAVAQARAQLAYKRQELAVLAADVRAAESKVADAATAIGTARIALEDTEVWAPIAGTVANRRTHVGEYVTVGTRMLSIVPQEGLWIEANFRETQIGRMRPLDPARIEIDAHPGRPLCGYVESLGAASGSEFALIPSDNATGNFTKIVRRFPVRLRPGAHDPNADLLRPGMSVVVRVAVGLEGDGAYPAARAERVGCRFDPAADVRPPSLPELPPHPGLGRRDGAAAGIGNAEEDRP
jgi:membrane fusion protein, multidrug efflux system